MSDLSERPLGHWETIGKDLDDTNAFKTDRARWAKVTTEMENAGDEVKYDVTRTADANGSWQKAGRMLDRKILRETPPPPQKIYGTLDAKDSMYFERVLVRANNMMQQARTINMGQYSHGINGAISTIEWLLKKFEENPPKSWSSARLDIDRLADTTMQLGGYMHCLKNGM